MLSSQKIVADVVKESVIPVLCSLALGLLLYQGAIFNPHLSSFQIIVNAITGSLFFLTLRVNRRNAVAVLLVLFVLEVGLFTRPASATGLFRDLMLKGALAASFTVFFTSFYTKTPGLRYLHPLVLAALFSIFAIVASAVLIAVERLDEVMTWRSLLFGVQLNAVNCFIVGLGTGVGILLLDNGILTKMKGLLLAGRRFWRDAFHQFEQHI